MLVVSSVNNKSSFLNTNKLSAKIIRHKISHNSTLY